MVIVIVVYQHSGMGRKNAGAVTAIDVKIAVNRTLFRRPFSLLLHFVRFLVGAQLLGRVPCLQLHTAQLPLVFRLHNQLPQFLQLYTVVRSYFRCSFTGFNSRLFLF